MLPMEYTSTACQRFLPFPPLMSVASPGLHIRSSYLPLSVYLRLLLPPPRVKMGGHQPVNKDTLPQPLAPLAKVPPATAPASSCPSSCPRLPRIPITPLWALLSAMTELRPSGSKSTPVTRLLHSLVRAVNTQDNRARSYLFNFSRPKKK